MKGYFKVLCLILAISLLCSCGKTANNNSQGTLNSVTNESNTSENSVSESAIPEAMATFSKEKSPTATAWQRTESRTKFQ